MTEQDKQLSIKLGLTDLAESEQLKRLAQFKETLQIKIGLRLEDELDDEQLNTVVNLVDKSGSSEAEHWLRSNVPNYEQIYSEEYDSLVEAIKKDTSLVKSILEKF